MSVADWIALYRYCEKEFPQIFGDRAPDELAITRSIMGLSPAGRAALQHHKGVTQ